MKSQYNKSRIMKNAWRTYRQDKRVSFRTGGMSFAFALRIAWKQEKREVEVRNRREAQKNAPVVVKPVEFSPAFAAGIAEYYNGRGSERRYFGD